MAALFVKDDEHGRSEPQLDLVLLRRRALQMRADPGADRDHLGAHYDREHGVAADAVWADSINAWHCADADPLLLDLLGKASSTLEGLLEYSDMTTTRQCRSQFGLAGITREWTTLLLMFGLCALSACGGGGTATDASNSTSPPPGAAGGTSVAGSMPTSGTVSSSSMVVSPSSVSVTTDITQSSASAIVLVSVQSTSGGTFYVGRTVTHEGVDTVSVMVSGNTLLITIQFKAPSVVGPGTYSDVLTLYACVDQACTQQINNSPAIVPITYLVTPPVPLLNNLSTTSVVAGAPGFTLTITGYNFLSSTQVLWNGSLRTPTIVSGSELNIPVSAADLLTSGTVNVQLANGTAKSSIATLTIIPLAAFTFTDISPHHVGAGGGPFYVSAVGNGFTSTSAIAWNGITLPTTYLSSTLIRAAVTADLIASAGTASITVVNAPSSVGAAGVKSLAIDPASLDATSFQINPAHTGAISFHNLQLPNAATWSVDVGGQPSYAVIVGGKVIVSVKVGANSQLLALDAATGAVSWGPISYTGLVNVAYDNNRLFVVSGTSTTQIIHALDFATGNSLWSGTVQGNFDPVPPVASDGIVYAANEGAVTAFDESTGAVLWNGTIFIGGYGALAVTPDGVYGAAPCTATDLHPAVGATIWRTNSGCDGGGGGTPVVAGGLMYSPQYSLNAGPTIFDAESGVIEGTYTADVIPSFNSTTGFFLQNHTLRGISTSNNQTIWSFAGDGQLQSAPIIVNDYVFIGSASGNLYAVDAATGMQMWSTTLGGPIPATTDSGAPSIYSGLSAGDGLLAVPNGTTVTLFTLSVSP